MTKEEFIKELEKLSINITIDQLNKLDMYYKLLIEWNNKINLTRITEKKDVYLKHFYDSITLIKAIDLNKNLNVCDIGTGAGFPGIVLKIMFPNLNITLIDSLDKRIKFLQEVINTLKLDNIKANHARAEEYTKINRNKFDLVTCRAVSKLNIISEICIPAVKINGYFISMKANIEDEIINTTYLKKLNSNIEEIITFKLPYEESIRNLVKIKKEKDTVLYPRTYDKILKKPL